MKKLISYFSIFLISLSQLIAMEPSHTPALDKHVQAFVKKRLLKRLAKKTKETALPLKYVIEHKKNIYLSKLSPDGSSLITSSKGEEYQEVYDLWVVPDMIYPGTDTFVWNTLTGKKIHKLAHYSDIHTMNFSSDSRLLLTSSRDATNLLDLSRGKIHKLSHASLLERTERFNVELHSEKNYFVLTIPMTSTTCRILLYKWEASPENMYTSFELKLQGNNPKTIVSPNWSTNIIYDSTGAQVIDISSEKLLQTLEHTNMKDIIFSPDATKIMTLSPVEIKVWNQSTGMNLLSLHRHSNNNSREAQFSPDSSMLITTSEDCTAELWDIIKIKKLHTLKCSNPINRVQFNPDGKIALTFSGEETTFWDVHTGKALFFLPKEKDSAGLMIMANNLLGRRSSSKIEVLDFGIKKQTLEILSQLSMIQAVILNRALNANENNEDYVLDMRNDDHVEEIIALRRIPYNIRLFLKKQVGLKIRINRINLLNKYVRPLVASCKKQRLYDCDE